MTTFPILISEDTEQDIVVDRPALLVGRSRRRSDIRINDRTVSSVHCEISLGENCLKVRNQGRNGIRLNGQKVDDGVLLDGDTLEIANFRFRLDLNGNAISAKSDTDQSHSKANVWFVRLAGIELGPMPWVELSGMAQRGELTESDQVRWRGEKDWKSASTVDGLLTPPAPRPAVMAGSDTIRVPSDRSVGERESARPENPSGSSMQPEDARATEFDCEIPDRAPGDAVDFSDSSRNVSDESPTAEDPASLDDTATSRIGETATSSTYLKLDQFEVSDEGDEAAEDSAARAPIDFVNDSSHDSISDRQDQTILDDLAADLKDDSKWGDPAGQIPAVSSSGENTEVQPAIADADGDSANWSGPQPQPVPVPRPLPPPPKFTPPVRRTESGLERFCSTVLEPVFDKVPLLQTWPGVVAVLAGIGLLIFMMLPAYEGAYVTGTVTLDGEPLPGVSITFTDLKLGYGASAVVDENGSFEVETLDGGMMPGKYSVAIMPLKAESPEVVEELQRQYQEERGAGASAYDESGEGTAASSSKVHGAEEEGQHFLLPPGVVPFRYRSIQTSGLVQEISAEGSNELLIELKTG